MWAASDLEQLSALVDEIPIIEPVWPGGFKQSALNFLDALAPTLEAHGVRLAV